jgi:thioredoxin reductase (NADPH)
VSGCINDDGTIAVDDHGRTSVEGVYAVGNVTPGHNQIPVAGDEVPAVSDRLREYAARFRDPGETTEAGADD